jgi:hypothetical protein
MPKKKYKTYEGKRFTHVGNISYAVNKKTKGRRLQKEKKYWANRGFYVRSHLVEIQFGKKMLRYYEIYVRNKNLSMP